MRESRGSVQLTLSVIKAELRALNAVEALGQQFAAEELDMDVYVIINLLNLN